MDIYEQWNRISGNLEIRCQGSGNHFMRVYPCNVLSKRTRSTIYVQTKAPHALRYYVWHQCLDVDAITVMGNVINDWIGHWTVIPKKWSYHSSDLYWKQKGIVDFLRFWLISLKRPLCSESIGFNRSHSSRIRTTGLAYLDIAFYSCRLFVTFPEQKVDQEEGDIWYRNTGNKPTCIDLYW